jgi:hypothetical protein
MCASKARGPFFSPDISKLQQADGLRQVYLFLAEESHLSFVGMVTGMMRAFGPLTVRLIGPPWLKVIWTPSFVTKPFW